MDKQKAAKLSKFLSQYSYSELTQAKAYLEDHLDKDDPQAQLMLEMFDILTAEEVQAQQLSFQMEAISHPKNQKPLL